jgi:hypothetical protein
MIGTEVAIIAGLAITLTLWIITGLVSAAAHVIVTAVLYQFAAGKDVPPQFDRDMLEGAFRRK